MLKLSNLRLGFANNSSSSHSILLCNALKHGYKDQMLDECSLGDGEPYFGWESFVCASPEAKRQYFACQLATTLSRDVGKDIAGLAISALLGVPKAFGAGVVDHQSVITLPRDRDGHLAINFIKELFEEAINNPRIVVGGGNDNSDDSPLVASDGTKHPWFERLPVDSSAVLIARPEPYGWCLFNQRTGARIRLQREVAANVLPETPELVDICITKHCRKSCSFCYQDCGYEGKHADKEWLDSLMWNLKTLNVFEVVLGGGEPTTHPHFIDILKGFRTYGIVPNFTTADVAWLRNKGIVETVVADAGSVAFSCHSLYDVKRIGRSILLAGEDIASKAVLQSIVGIVPPKELKQMIALAETMGFRHYSLVGFKQTGRAPEVMPHAIDEYNLSKLIKGFHLRFYADTALLKLCPSIVEQYTCDVAEGKQSMYIDAVNKTMAESSYTGKAVPFSDNRYPGADEIAQIFQTFQGYDDK